MADARGIMNWLHAIAEGWRKEPPPAPHGSRRVILAKQLWEPRRDAIYTPIASTDLARGDHILVEAGDLIPCDGEVIQGTAWVDEAGGQSAPVIRESGAERSSVIRGFRVLSGWLVIRLTGNFAETGWGT